MMITVTFLVTFISLLILVAGIDVMILQQPLMFNFIKLFSLEQGTNEGFVNVTAAVGLISSIVLDYRISKSKRAKKS